jgi:hypothetical protein
MSERSEPREGLPYECDLVMKGGITSGIVYPAAIVDIAADHRLRSIGGSSAGAIAAAAAAAAELGRYADGGGFDRLATLPSELGTTDASGRTLLQRLFQAQPATADAFDLFWTWRSHAGPARVRAVIGAVRRHGRAPWWLHLTGFVVVAAAVALFVAATSAEESWGLVGGAALFVLGLVLWVLAAIVAQIARGAARVATAARAGVDGNHLGVCNGRTPPGSSTPALTDWLHDTIQALAGQDGVVTYGDLAAVGVDLVTMVTDLTHGTAEPFPLASRVWAFAEQDMRALFPDAVVHHLLRAGAAPGDAQLQAALQATGLHPLPPPEDLPILLGARMSLSFPVLIAAVPLYAWQPVLQPDGGWKMELVRCWFSDGGITSNLPVHLFDAPLPRRPTYAINLGGGGDGLADCDRIRRPIDARAGQRPLTRSIDSTVGLGSALFDTMQNWSDNALIRAPGYRDRICTVRLAEGEGGMNLDMPPATISALATRGRLAGQNLAWIQRGPAGRPDCPPAATLDDAQLDNQWERHRFTRYRTFLGGLSRYLGQAAGRFGGKKGYAALGRSAAKDDTLPYKDGWSLTRAKGVEQDLDTTFATDLGRMADGAPVGAALGFDARARPAQSTD